MSILCPLLGYGQVVDDSFGYYNDALLFGRTQGIGTARMQAIGGAQIALGGDVSNAYFNPAGLGFLRGSVFTITPSIDFSNADAQYFDINTTDSKVNFNIANAGIVFNFTKSDLEQGKFRGGSFAITLTRENNFNNSTTYQARNSQAQGSSIVDTWASDAWGIPENDLGGILYDAYNQYLISPYPHPDDPTFTVYDKYIGNPFAGEDRQIGSNPNQVSTTETKGGQYQWDFAYGANYDDLLYFGASLSLNNINYESTTNFTESSFLLPDGSPDDAINSVRTENILKVRGNGVSGTFGLIVRPVDFFRIGMTAVTPTAYYNMNEEFSSGLYSSFNNWEYFIEADSSIILGEMAPAENFGEASYKFNAPGKISIGAALFAGKFGFVSADIDWINYAKASYKSSDFEIDADNQTIKNLYQNTINYRLGGELRMANFRLRGGYSYQGDPYVSSAIDNSIQKITGGLGYRNSDFFVDLAAVHTKYQTASSPYTYTIYYDDNTSEDASPEALIANTNLNVSVTVGFNF